MNDLPAFGYWTTHDCPKCGGRDADHPRYCTGGAVCTRWTSYAGPEHMHRFCQVCGYQLTERCRDDAQEQHDAV